MSLESRIQWFSNSIVDPTGRVGMVGDRVNRVIYDEDCATLYNKILQSDSSSKFVDAGLVKTRILEEKYFPGTHLVLEHEFIPFETHPAEHTNYMHWLAAEMVLQLSIELCKEGLFLKDAHPWNVMFHKGEPKFVDFSSITSQDVDIRKWLDEFYTYFVVPIWLASHKKFALARTYRREHTKGFGLQFFSHRVIRRIVFGRILNKVNKGFSKCEVLDDVLIWLKEKNPNKEEKAIWSNYDQAHASLDPMNPTTEKQKFVYNVLKTVKPATLLDCAANKGFYSEMGAGFGCKVAAFDVDEFSINECLLSAQKKRLKITPVVMDFMFPTSNYGLALSGRDAYERYRSDMVFGLGLIHHLCLRENMPLALFVQSLIRFARSDVILEYVDIDDRHVKAWNIQSPVNYSFNEVVINFKKNGWKLEQSLDINDDGIERKMLHFNTKKIV